VTQSVPPILLIHLATVIPAAVLGAFILSRKKGTPVHKLLGRVWVALMLISATASFWIRSNGAFSWIHILSIVTIVSIVSALIAIRRGNVRRHRRFMQGAYTGLVIAFLFTFTPDRLLGQWARQLLA
jgi:uncharacterized membrane protein